MPQTAAASRNSLTTSSLYASAGRIDYSPLNADCNVDCSSALAAWPMDETITLVWALRLDLGPIAGHAGGRSRLPGSGMSRNHHDPRGARTSRSGVLEPGLFA